MNLLGAAARFLPGRSPIPPPPLPPPFARVVGPPRKGGDGPQQADEIVGVVHEPREAPHPALRARRGSDEQRFAGLAQNFQVGPAV